MTTTASPFEYHRLTLPAGTTRDVAREVLTIHAQYGEWEVDRLRLWADGRRQVVLRRRFRRRTLPVPQPSL